MDVAFLLLGSIVGIAAAILLMLVLDHFGLMEEPFIWVSVVPILLVCWFANAARRKAAQHLSR